MEINYIPEAVIRRLPGYYRYLERLEKAGEVRISSAKMSQDLGLNASQIRRDLNYFGGFGQQGYGYSVEGLKGEIAHILGLDRRYNAVIMGAGNIGRALMGYNRFASMGFDIVGVFDNNLQKIDGSGVQNVSRLLELAEVMDIQIGMICTSPCSAQETADLLVNIGVKGIWNFTSVSLDVPEDIPVQNVNLNDSLFELCFRMNNLNAKITESETI